MMTQATVRVTVKVMSWLAEDLVPSGVPQNGLGNPSYVDLEKVIPCGMRLAELLAVLGREHPRLGEKISIAREGKPPLAVITLNGKIVSGGEELATVQLNDGDVVGVMPIFMGG